MSRKIFINLPVKDLPKSMAFYEAMGFKNNPQFTDATAACMVLSEEIFTMLLTHPKFQGFTPKAIPDATKTCQVMNAISFDSRAEVDSVVTKALAAGATEARKAEDLGFMYNRAINDLDGHVWEIFWMDPAAVQS